MSNHPTIAALKAALESERDELIANRESWLLECSCDPSSEFYDGGTCYYHLSESEKHKQNFNAGHEAATERLMGLLEKAVEMAEFYGNASTYYLKYRGVQVGPATIYGGTEIPTTEAFHEKGKKAREFLLSVSETVADATTLADASGEIKKESVGKDGK